jgi:hypothetical protein
MGLIDLILNVAALLLWLNWRALGLPAAPAAMTLASTLKPTEKRRGRSWSVLAALPALLLIRAFFYWQIGPEANWTPQLQLGAIVLSFRGDVFGHVLLFSGLSFLAALGVFYFWLCLLAAVNGGVSDQDPCQRLVRQHLGWLGRVHPAAQLAAPFAAAGLLWMATAHLFANLGMMPAPGSLNHLAQQAVVHSASLLLAAKYPLAGVMVLYLLNTYLYLGLAPFWNFVNLTGGNLLRPLAWCRVGKLDLSPLLGLAAVLALAEWGERWLPRLYQSLPLR